MITTITSCLVHNNELALTVADRLIGSEFRHDISIRSDPRLSVTIEQKIEIGPANTFAPKEVTSFLVSVEHDPLDMAAINNFIRDIVRKYWTEHGYPY